MSLYEEQRTQRSRCCEGEDRGWNEAGTSQGTTSSYETQFPEEANPVDAFTSDFPPPKLWEYTSVVFSHPFGGNFLSWPKKTFASHKRSHASSAPQEGKLSVGGQAKDSVKSSQGCDTHHDCGLCVLHREPAAFSAGDPRKNQSVLSTPSTLPTLFLKLVFILLHWVSVVALRPSCSEACRNLRSQARDQTISPALESGFLTKGPPAKSLCLLFNPVLGHFLCFNYQFNLG